MNIDKLKQTKEAVQNIRDYVREVVQVLEHDMKRTGREELNDTSSIAEWTINYLDYRLSREVDSINKEIGELS